MKTLWIPIGLCPVSVCLMCESSELLAIATLYRHGDRGPILFYKNDPYKNNQTELWPNGLGELTEAGKIRQFKMGEWFAKRYNDTLRFTENPSECLHVVSSDVDRCIMSADYHLSELFYPKIIVTWETSESVSVPIHTRPLPEDYLIAMQMPCAKYTQLLENFKNSEEYQKYLGSKKTLFELLSEKTGNDIKTTLDAALVHDTLLVEQQANLTLPSWTKGVFPEQTLPVAVAEFYYQAHTTELAKLKGGPLVDYIATFFEDVLAKSNNSLTYLMLSGHDLTQVVLLQALNLYDNFMPEYASTVIFELRREDDNNFVNILYKNSSDLYKFQLKDCAFDCPFTQFQTIIKPVRIEVDVWKTQCQDKE